MKKNLYIIVTAAASLAVLFLVLFSMPPGLDGLNPAHRLVVDSINRKWSHLDRTVPKHERALLDYDYLMSMLNGMEKNLAKRILTIEPERLGFRGEFSSVERPRGLVRISSVSLEAIDKGVTVETGIQYFPKKGYESFVRMMGSMEGEIKKRLYIDSGYRSPGRQLFLFFYYLASENGYSLKKNISMIVMPGYSQHNDPFNTAMDLVSIKGVNGYERGQTAEAFAALEEFSWLKKNAGRFGFRLSYPPVNLWGVTFEPWHWQYRK